MWLAWALIFWFSFIAIGVAVSKPSNRQPSDAARAMTVAIALSFILAIALFWLR